LAERKSRGAKPISNSGILGPAIATLLLWYQVSTKMNISQPVPSAIGSVDFGFLGAAEIKSLSVKRIDNPQTFDTLLHPVPGGLYDPALGAWGDHL